MMMMMQQKIVIRVQMNCDKCRSQAMEIAAKHGATEVKIEGDNKLVVVGNEIDSVSLTCCLRKKLHHGTAMIINQQEEKAKEDKQKCVDGKNSNIQPQKNNKEENPPLVCHLLPSLPPPPPYFIVQEVLDQPSSCSIM